MIEDAKNVKVFLKKNSFFRKIVSFNCIEIFYRITCIMVQSGHPIYNEVSTC